MAKKTTQSILDDAWKKKAGWQEPTEKPKKPKVVNKRAPKVNPLNASEQKLNDAWEKKTAKPKGVPKPKTPTVPKGMLAKLKTAWNKGGTKLAQTVAKRLALTAPAKAALGVAGPFGVAAGVGWTAYELMSAASDAFGWAGGENKRADNAPTGPRGQNNNKNKGPSVPSPSKRVTNNSIPSPRRVKKTTAVGSGPNVPSPSKRGKKEGPNVPSPSNRVTNNSIPSPRRVKKVEKKSAMDKTPPSKPEAPKKKKYVGKASPSVGLPEVIKNTAAHPSLREKSNPAKESRKPKSGPETSKTKKNPYGTEGIFTSLFGIDSNKLDYSTGTDARGKSRKQMAHGGPVFESKGGDPLDSHIVPGQGYKKARKR